jgi:hypothetical protein
MVDTSNGRTMSTTELSPEQEQLVDCPDQRVFELIGRVMLILDTI